MPTSDRSRPGRAERPGERRRRVRREDPRAAGAARARAAQDRRRASLSLDKIVAAAIATLDERGEAGLTLRGLAAELGSGVASLYWYAESKEELIGIVGDEVLGFALEEFAARNRAEGSATSTGKGEEPYRVDSQTSGATAAALVRLRVLVLCLFDVMMEHPWLAVQMLRSQPDHPNALRWWEQVGRQLAAMELTVAQQLPASLAVANYASGVGAESAMREGGVHEHGDEETRRLLEEQAQEWLALDAQDFPFIRSVASEFTVHDDRTQFVAGLDLLLGGIERQTWG